MPEADKKRSYVDQLVLWRRIETRLESSLPEWRAQVDVLEQVAAVEDREAKRRTWNDDQVFEALLLAVLSANTDWSRIERIRDELEPLFSGFNLESYAQRSRAEIGDRFVPWFRARKAGSVNLRRSLTGLIDTAWILVAYSRAHGAAEGYFTSLMVQSAGDPKRAALCLGCPGRYKLPSLGVALAAEALKNLGFNVAKPDRHVMRAVGSFGLVHFGHWSDNENLRRGRKAPNPTPRRQLAAMTAVEEIAKAADEPVVLVDNAIWLMCAKSGEKKGLHLTNSELAGLAREEGPTDDRTEHLTPLFRGRSKPVHEEEPPHYRADSLGALLQSWANEDDGGEHRETMEHLARALDDERLSYRKHFPEELKGKSW